MKNEVRQTIRFPEDVYSKLRRIAEKQERSVNWEVVAAAKLLIEQYEREHGQIE